MPEDSYKAKGEAQSEWNRVLQRWPEHVIGIDFSGAEDAGRRIWLAEGFVRGSGVTIERCFPAEALPDSARERGASLAALQAFVAQQGGCVVGLDFPFGLPAPLVSETHWLDFALAFGSRFPSPGAFRDCCVAAAGGRELKRRTEREARTPFAAYNLRLYRQTYYGIRDVLAPLVRADLARALPIQRPRPGVPWLLEICPASTLKRLALYRPYKGSGAALRSARAEILDAVAAVGPFRLEPALCPLLVENSGGDALDSVLAALGAFSALHDPELLVAPHTPEHAIEGRVYT